MKKKLFPLFVIVFFFILFFTPLLSKAKTSEQEWTKIEYSDDIVMGYTPLEITIYNMGLQYIDTGTNETLQPYISYYEIRYDNGFGYETLAYKVFGTEEYIAPHGYIRVKLDLSDISLNTTGSEYELPLKIIIKSNLGRIIGNDIYNIDVKIVYPISAIEFLSLTFFILAVPIYGVVAVVYFNYIKERKMDNVSFIKILATLPFTMIQDYFNKDRAISSAEYIHTLKKKVKHIVKEDKIARRRESKKIRMLRVFCGIFLAFFTATLIAYFVAYPILDVNMTLFLLFYLIYLLIYTLFINRFLRYQITMIIPPIFFSLAFTVLVALGFYLYSVLVLDAKTFVEIQTALRNTLPSIF